MWDGRQREKCTYCDSSSFGPALFEIWWPDTYLGGPYGPVKDKMYWPGGLKSAPGQCLCRELLSCLGIYNPDTNPAPKLTIHPSQRSTIDKCANARSSKHFVYFIKKCDLKLVDKYLLIIAISNSMFCDL